MSNLITSVCHLALTSFNFTAALAAMTISSTAVAGPSQIELESAHGFPQTLERLTKVMEGAGMTIFARIDHQAAAISAGLMMPPTTVIIYGNPKAGTPLMLAAPEIALDLPLRVLVREDAAGHTLVSFHPGVSATRAAGLDDDYAANLNKAETLIANAIKP